MSSAIGTRNLMEAFADNGVARRFVNVSSFAVYSNFNLRRGAVLDEECEIERHSVERHDAYGFGKIKQEQIVVQLGDSRNVPYVVVRPGVVFGPGKKALSGRIGTDAFGVFLHIGGRNLLPLTFVDNCAEAIVLTGLTPGIDNQVFNVVDDELLTSRQFLAAFKKRNRGFRTVTVPYALAYAFCAAWEGYSRRSKGQLPPAFNRRRCVAEWRSQRYANDKLKKLTGWSPRIGIDEALRQFLQQYE
jgi:nucleoside-diphosphate-sugar epimerase